MKDSDRRRSGQSGSIPLNLILERHPDADSSLADASRGFSRAYNDAVAIERGPLVFALPIDSRVEEGQGPANLRSTTGRFTRNPPGITRFEIDREHPERSIVFEERAVGRQPFSPAGRPVVARVKGRALVGWGLERGAAAPPPQSPVDQHGAARGTDADPVRLHRPADHRVPNSGHTVR